MGAEVKTLLREMTRRLVAEFQPCQIYLFGSHAWGKPNEDSDVDLLVIMPDSDETGKYAPGTACEICGCQKIFWSRLRAK